MQTNTLLLIGSCPALFSKVHKPLEKEGVRTIHCKQSYDILDLIREHQPELIILQPGRGAENPCHTLVRLRKTPEGRTLPVILVFSARQEKLLEECSDMTYTDFIFSPLREKELVFRVKHQIALLKANRTILRRNEQLKKIIEERERLYTLIAHDLRSPIGTVKMLNDFILEDNSCRSCPGITEKLLMIKNITDNVFTLLENLLQWSQSQRKRVNPRTETFDVTATVRQVLVLYSQIATAKKIRLVDEAHIPVYVQADEEMIKTVLRNLLSNAIKFSYPGGKIEVGISRERELAIVSVKDEGRGMNREELSKLKKEGKKNSRPGTRQESGFGLGLALSQEFIRRNKGTLSFTSGPGSGSTFCFTLPSGHNKAPKINGATRLYTSVKRPTHP